MSSKYDPRDFPGTEGARWLYRLMSTENLRDTSKNAEQFRWGKGTQHGDVDGGRGRQAAKRTLFCGAALTLCAGRSFCPDPEKPSVQPVIPFSFRSAAEMFQVTGELLAQVALRAHASDTAPPLQARHDKNRRDAQRREANGRFPRHAAGAAAARRPGHGFDAC